MVAAVNEAKVDVDPADKPRRIRTVRVSMATRLAASVVAVSFIALVIATAVGLNSGRELGKEIYENRLKSLEFSGGFDVAAHLRSTTRTANSLAASPQAVVALDLFSNAFDKLSEEDLDVPLDEIIETYEDRYLDPLAELDRPIQIRALLSEATAATYLQYNYAVNLGVIDQPSFVDDALDGTEWSETHSAVHPVYRNVAQQLDLLDVYLVEPDEHRVLYSVAKRPDLGTDLQTGPFSGSVLANTVDSVIRNPERGTVISDLAFYNGAPGLQVGVVASPVMDGDELAGVVALMYDGGVFTEILTANSNWDQAGIPDTGDVYLVGFDSTTRSDPRPFLEDSSAYLDASEAAGLLSEAERKVIVADGTTVLTQRIVGATFLAGVDGNDAVTMRRSLTGEEVFGTIAPVPHEGVSWMIVSEIGVVAAEDGLNEFRDILIASVAIFVVLLSFFAVAWANRTMRPVRAISDRLGVGGRDHGPLELHERSPVELRHLASSFESMSETLDKQQVALALAREERLKVMRRMLPVAVADRIAAGDLQSVDDVPQASVAVLVVLGLGDLVRSDDLSGLAIVDKMLADLDELAEQHGLDRVKVVGDAYFASCGHDRPFVDHAPRSVAFARDAQDLLLELNRQSSTHLDAAVGIHTGSVTVGMTGGSRLVYDVWGETVTTAHHLARRAGPGQVIISSETRDMLPQTLRTEEITTIDGAQLWNVVENPEEGLA